TTNRPATPPLFPYTTLFRSHPEKSPSPAWGARAVSNAQPLHYSLRSPARITAPWPRSGDGARRLPRPVIERGAHSSVCRGIHDARPAPRLRARMAGNRAGIVRLQGDTAATRGFACRDSRSCRNDGRDGVPRPAAPRIRTPSLPPRTWPRRARGPVAFRSQEKYSLTAFPLIASIGTNPQYRESRDWSRLSPITK